MALVLADRVKDSTTSTGTGTITLANSPPTGFQSFATIGDGNTTYYTISGGSEWEVGIGTYTSSGTTLSRDTIFSSSNSGSLVNFSAGVKDVFVTLPSQRSYGIPFSTKTTTYTASPNEGILANTSGGAFTITLPASPVAGTQVIVGDANNTWGTNNLTLARNGSTIEGLTEDLVCDITGVSVQLIYSGTTWQVFAQVGASATNALTTASIGVTVQGYDGDLQAIADLSGTSGLLQKTGANTWTLNTSTYLTTASAASTYAPLASPTFSGTVSDGLGKLRAIPQSGSAKTTSYTLATTDVGTYIQVGSGGSITIPDATFSAGDAISVFNNTAGNITITCSITTAYIGGTDSDKATMTLATRGVATILFISGTVCVVSGNVS